MLLSATMMVCSSRAYSVEHCDWFLKVKLLRPTVTHRYQKWTRWLTLHASRLNVSAMECGRKDSP